jgi:prepilin-type N-terminal cleavage/methylation domain-containing protein
MRKQAGFTILELLIVIGLIVIVAAIAIPSLLKARVSREEAAAVQSLNSINSAQISYFQAYANKHGYACQLSFLGPPLGSTAPNSTAADLVDVQLSSGTKDGYNYSMNCTPPSAAGKAGFEVKATPLGANISDSPCGNDKGRCFYINNSGRVYQLVGSGNSYGTAFSLAPIS